MDVQRSAFDVPFKTPNAASPTPNVEWPATLPDQELVTSIEILSPSNKDASGRGKYWAKRAEVIRQDVNLVEIDLLLDGRRPEVVGTMPTGNFFAFVSRGSERPRCDVYGWSIRDALPSVPIPLKSGDADVLLDLASAFFMPYERNHYRQTLRYDRPLTGHISDTDRQWAADAVK